MKCPCENTKRSMPKCDAGTPPVLEINGGECPVLFHTINIPASAGDVETLPPTPGAYRNTRVYYEADQIAYLYDSDGIPQLLSIPRENHDAATVAQGNKLMTAAPTTTNSGVLGQLWTDTSAMHTYQLTAIDTTDPDNPVYTWTMRW